jgi:ATPase subunit of ABC transporter with duplicated ATPase domains
MFGSAATLTATDLRRERASEFVLAGISLTLAPGDRVGVVGPNGVGKTTLLRILAGLERPDAGRVEVSPPGASVGYLAQIRERPSGYSVEDYLRHGAGLAEAEAALESAVQAMAGGQMGERALDRYAHALEHLNQLGPDDFGERAAKALVDLRAPPGLLSAPVATLSGGELARVYLAAVMLARFDITLLDEPTNDLDFDGLDRLERLVTGMTGAVMIVSHDRAFLARTVNSVLELDLHSRQATSFNGGWEAYLQEKAALSRHREEAYDKYSQARDDLKGRAQRERLWATSGVSRERKRPRDNDKAQRDFRINRTEQLASRARRTEKALERLEEVERPWEDWQLRYTVKLAPRAGAVVASLDKAVVDRGPFRLGPVDLVVEWGARLAVTGRNGSGKTTLVDALLGRLPLSSGCCTVGPSVVPGELGQERSGLLGSGVGDVRQTDVLAAFLSATGFTVPEARSLLAKFGLGAGHVGRPLSSLSPGERTRAQLACFQAVGVNFLVLDEPTNHLDMPAIEQLEAALASYEGTLLIVTHDRRMLEGLRLTHRAEVADGRLTVSAA